MQLESSHSSSSTHLLSQTTTAHLRLPKLCSKTSTQCCSSHYLHHSTSYAHLQHQLQPPLLQHQTKKVICYLNTQPDTLANLQDVGRICACPGCTVRTVHVLHVQDSFLPHLKAPEKIKQSHSLPLQTNFQRRAPSELNPQNQKPTQNTLGTKAQCGTFPESSPAAQSQHTHKETICQATQISGWKPEDSSEKPSLCHQAPTSKPLPRVIQYLHRAHQEKGGNGNTRWDPAVLLPLHHQAQHIQSWALQPSL